MKEKEIFWVGDSLKILKQFPDSVKQNIGNDLRRLQLGLLPLDFKPMKTISKGVFELRDRDEKSWYRLIYYIKVKQKIYVLHSFTKSSSKTPIKELKITSKRLKILLEQLKQE